MNSAKNRADRHTFGYTIVEVMIVLAISGVMFLIAAEFINGKAAKASFTQGVNEMASIIQKSLDDVTNGEYSDAPLGCTFTFNLSTGTWKTTVNSQVSGATQGTNSDCVYLGKLIEFYPNTDNTYAVLSVAGGREANGQAVEQIDGSSGTELQADPAIVTPILIQKIPQGLQVNSMTATTTQLFGGSPQKSNTFGFLQSLGNFDSSTGNLLSGAQTTDLYAAYGNISFPPTTPVDGNTTFDYSGNRGPELDPSDQVDICISNGGISSGSEYADIVVGDTNGSISVNIKMLGPQQQSPCIGNWFMA